MQAVFASHRLYRLCSWRSSTVAPFGLNGEQIRVKMPARYLAEMICDRIGASKIYKGKDYTNSSPLEYFLARKDMYFMHPETAKKLEYYLTLLSEKGEKAMFAELKAFVKQSKKKNKK